jgi:hypothetical protein
MSRIIEKVADEIYADIEGVEQARGELALEVHLMNMELKSRWHGFEKDWEALRNDAKLRAGSKGHALADRLKEGYRQMKRDLGRSVV